MFDKKSDATRASKSAGASTHTETGINFEKQQLAEELHKPIIRRFKIRKGIKDII